MGECCCTVTPQGTEESSCCDSSENAPCDCNGLPSVSTSLNVKDVFGACKARWGFGRMNYKVEQGIYKVNNPDTSSPVLVSANYKLTFDTLRKNLSELDC